MADVKRPAGDLYDWYQRGLALLRNGDPAAAGQLLAHAHDSEPGSRSIREALARARFDSGDFRSSARIFSKLVTEDPADDYAHFGLGLALDRLGESTTAHGHLSMAATMRPANSEYQDALRAVRQGSGSDRSTGHGESA